jgi:hypothetical protein
MSQDDTTVCILPKHLSVNRATDACSENISGSILLITEKMSSSLCCEEFTLVLQKLCQS